jgi:hypothetical protein
MARIRPRTSSRTTAAATSNAEETRVVPRPGGIAGAAGAESGYTLSVESDRVVVRHTGELTVSAIEASRRVVVELATERRLTRILLDLSGATTGLAPVDIFELCASQGFALPPGAIVAVVHRPDQFPAEDARFAEAVTLNRGATLRAFTDFDAARLWLTGR